MDYKEAITTLDYTETLRDFIKSQQAEIDNLETFIEAQNLTIAKQKDALERKPDTFYSANTTGRIPRWVVPDLVARTLFMTTQLILDTEMASDFTKVVSFRFTDHYHLTKLPDGTWELEDAE